MNEKELTRFTRKVTQVLSNETLGALSRESSFVQREREVTSSNLMLSLIHALGSQQVETIADLQRSFNAMTDKNIRYKPFYNQLSLFRIMDPGVFRIMDPPVEARFLFS